MWFVWNICWCSEVSHSESQNCLQKSAKLLMIIMIMQLHMQMIKVSQKSYWAIGNSRKWYVS